MNSIRNKNFIFFKLVRVAKEKDFHECLMGT